MVRKNKLSKNLYKQRMWRWRTSISNKVLENKEKHKPLIWKYYVDEITKMKEIQTGQASLFLLFKKYFGALFSKVQNWH